MSRRTFKTADAASWAFYQSLTDVEVAALLNDADAYVAALDEEEEERRLLEEGECNCSDPDCPCKGSKRYSAAYLGLRRY